MLMITAVKHSATICALLFVESDSALVKFTWRSMIDPLRCVAIVEWVLLTSRDAYIDQWCVRTLISDVYINDVYLQDPREKLIMSLKREIKILRQENHYLRSQVSWRHIHRSCGYPACTAACSATAISTFLSIICTPFIPILSFCCGLWRCWYVPETVCYRGLHHLSVSTLELHVFANALGLTTLPRA